MKILTLDKEEGVILNKDLTFKFIRNENSVELRYLDGGEWWFAGDYPNSVFDVNESEGIIKFNKRR